MAVQPQISESQGEVTIGRLDVRDLALSYPGPGGNRTTVLDIAALSVEAGDLVGVTGPSGSGKTSLLYALTGIESVERGSVVWGEVDLAHLGEAARDRWRRRHVGLVFQDFHLIPGLSVEDNVLVSAFFARARVPGALRARAGSLLQRVGAPTARRGVETLSRGEQQRVALARALLHDPPILVADEPTASLDRMTGQAAIGLLLDRVADGARTLIAVTHDPAFLERLPTIYWLQDGRLERRR